MNEASHGRPFARPTKCRLFVVFTAIASGESV
jgi:hypothetical protein